MTHEYTIQRYAAYFRGWCQSFGEHESIHKEGTGTWWLISDYQAGFVCRSQLTISLFREVLKKNYTPLLDLGRKGARIGSFHYPLSGATDEQCIAEIKKILDDGSNSCLFMTSRFMCGTGARILTLSSKKPLTTIYREIGCMRIRLD